MIYKIAKNIGGGELAINHARWPWQKGYGFKDKPFMGRHGGGWEYKFGLQISSKFKCWHLMLGLGTVTIAYHTPEDVEQERLWQESRAKRGI